MSSYLERAKEVDRRSPTTHGAADLESRRQNKLEGADRRGLVIRWADYPDWIKLHDPLSGEWHEVRAAECLPNVVQTANAHR